MQRVFWARLNVSIMSIILIFIGILLYIILHKKIIGVKNVSCDIFIAFIFAFLLTYLFRYAILSVKDYPYVSTNEYIEGYGTVVEYTRSYFDGDLSETVYYMPKFLLEDGTYIVADINNTEIGEKYYIRCLSNTKITQITDEAGKITYSNFMLVR